MLLRTLFFSSLLAVAWPVSALASAGTLSTFLGPEPVAGVSVSGFSASGSWTGATAPSLVIPSGVFSIYETRTHPDPASSPNSPYQAVTLIQGASGPGSFGPGGGFGGGFGGTMRGGSLVVAGLGLQGFAVNSTKFFASPTQGCSVGLSYAGVAVCMTLPLSGIGSTGVETAATSIVGNPLQVSVLALGNWTTGAVAVNDHTVGLSAFCAGAGPCAPIALTANDFTTVFSVAGSHSGSQITLVTPFVVKIRGFTTQNVAGYARLTISVPEPGTLVLLGTCVAGLLMLGRRQERS